ncbi:MAG: hypothetical protein LBD11_03150 [Candidatus Peribacteria bacterium]|nr:hypothetical protein [Candidatus Peribacteria bacterium]
MKEKEDINTQAHEILDYLYEFKEENEDTEDYTSIVIDVLNSGASNKAIAKSLNEKGISLVSYAR